jgi:hypothetical protein
MAAQTMFAVQIGERLDFPGAFETPVVSLQVSARLRAVPKACRPLCAALRNSLIHRPHQVAAVLNLSWQNGGPMPERSGRLRWMRGAVSL